MTTMINYMINLVYYSKNSDQLLVNFVDLIGEEHIIEEFVGVASLGCQYYAVVGQDAEAGAGMTNGLHGILHLVQSTLRGEDGCFRVIATSLQR